MDASPREQPSAEALFADFLDRLEAGEPVDFEAFCAAHPERASALRKVHVRWQAMSRAFTHLSQDVAAAAPPAVPSPSVDALRVRLASPGGRLARYVLRDEIARGAMGRIVGAWDGELRREVALKIHRADPGDARAQRRFLAEAQIAAQLDHPGIVPVHELGLDDAGRPFFSMQLVRGRDLGEVLALVPAGTDGWSRTRVLHVLLRVCEAMAFAHDKGVVHRDLKPANVMVGRFGETYVMDWGLAHVHGRADDGAVVTLRDEIADEDAASALLTRSGDVLGTPAYMAPEQAARDRRDVSPLVDVYALGAILYQLLAGEMPYARGTRSADDVLAALRAGPPPPLRTDVPAELRAIQERAMARDPAQRYPSMQALADDLRAFLEVRTVRAYATGRFAELRKWIARNRALATVLAASLLALLGGAVAMTALWARAEHDRTRADASAAQLSVELDRSAFRSARQALQLEHSTAAADALWRTHFAGRMPRATSWTLLELARRDPYLATLPIHRHGLPVAFTPRGDAVLAGDADGRVYVRDPDTLALRASLGANGAAIGAVTVTADGLHAVAGAADGSVRVWDLRTGAQLCSVAAHRGAVRFLVACGDGFASGGADGRVLWWPRPDAAPAEHLRHGHGITALAARPNGDGLIAGDETGWVSGRAFDGSWQFGRRWGAYVTAIAFGDELHQMWLGSTDRLVRFVDLRDETRARAFATRNGTSRQIVRLRDGSLLVGGWWRTDRMTANGELSRVALRGVSRVAIDREQRRLVTSGEGSGLGVVDLEQRDHRDVATDGWLALSRDGTRLLARTAAGFSLRDIASDRELALLPRGNCETGQLDRDGSRVVFVARDARSITLHDVATARSVWTFRCPEGVASLGNVDFAPDCSEVIASLDGRAIVRLRASDGGVLESLALPAEQCHRLAWSLDGRCLATIHREHDQVHVRDLRADTWRSEAFAAPRASGGGTGLAAVALSADGGKVAVGTWGGNVMVRHRDGTTAELPGHAGTVWNVAFLASDDGLLLSSGGSQGVACWDLDSNECCYQAVGDEAMQMLVSDDGRTLACRLPEGGVVLDLAYWRRHIAGNLLYQLDRLRGSEGIAAARERELRAWAATTMAEPWPRWR